MSVTFKRLILSGISKHKENFMGGNFLFLPELLKTINFLCFIKHKDKANLQRKRKRERERERIRL